ncbi:MAG: hypothetical protein U0326_18795 [Polyangiales bacterium]
MGTFGNEFVNVLDLDPMLDNGGVGNVQRRLQRVLDVTSSGEGIAASQSHSPGGIVYLPPGQYRIAREGTRPIPATYNDEVLTAPDLLIHENVQVWFAPGARLILEQDVIVSILGSLRAEVAQIFEKRPISPGHREGRVVILSSKVPALFPEWWGARARLDEAIPTSPTDDASALRDCFRAAHTDRSFGGRNYPVIPVILSGEYTVGSEIVIEPKDAARLPTPGHEPDLRDPAWRDVSGQKKIDGVVIVGRRSTGSTGAGVPTLKGSGATFSARGEREVVGRALLRIVDLHGSTIDGVNFDAGGADDTGGVASVCVQITGGSQLNVFRGCAFTNARHALVQVGDYVIEDTSPPIPAMGAGNPPLPRLDGRVRANWDLSGLSFEHCIFSVGTRRATWRDQLVGLVFHAHETLPMTLDQCKFSGPMLACVEAYGGALIIRGGTAQNQMTASPYRERRSTSDVWRDRPRGGVDIFIGDPLLSTPGNAIRPTALTVFEFQSQSDQFLDTFRHLSASVGRVAFQPSVLQGVTHNVTSDGAATAPPAIFWSGPAASSMPVARAGSLTLVGCTFAGPRPGAPDRMGDGSDPPSGAIVVDQLALGTAVADVGTAAEYTRTDSTNLFYQYNRMGGGVPVFQQLSGARLSAFPWYRKL